MPRNRAAAAALAAFAAALFFSFVVAGATRPGSIFPKYLEAAAAPPAEQSERLLDYSPLYLALTRVLAPWGYRAILAFQCLLHGVAAAAVAASVALLAGSGWGLAAGLGVAAYRPFLVYCGTHEPETLVVAALALAVLLGLAARGRGHPPPVLPPSPPATPPRGEGRDRRLPASPAAVGASNRSDLEDPSAEGSSPLGGVVGGDGGRTGGGWNLLAAAGAAACLAAAGLSRPQHLLLVPVWALWMSRGRPFQSPGRRLAAVALLVPTLFVVPLLISRARAIGVPTIMDPGAVFYEGNGPGATGLIRFAPQAIFFLERAHPETFDYGHVAYRRIAAFATGKPTTPALSNRYWTGLGFESLKAWPGRALARFLRKAALALSPYEAQDLENSEAFDRRLRRRLPWGFCVLLVSLPWIALARPERRRELSGPLVVAALAFAVQAGLYASARQRLPLALALWIAGPVLAADLVRGELTPAVRRSLALLAGLTVAAGLAAATARYALLDQLGWDAALGPETPSLGSRLVAFEEGRALRPELARSARRFAAAVDLAQRGQAAESLRAVAPLLGAGRDFTVDEKEVGVPEYWAARDLLLLGDRARAALAAQAAWTTRPDDPRIAALALRLRRPRGAPEPPAWRPPGTDPLSATLARAQAAAADGDRAAASALLRSLAAGFPELAERQTSPSLAKHGKN